MNNALEEAQEEAKSDMTPMIDCVFLMIIFFICIDFKVLEAKLPAYLPKDKGSQATSVEPQEQLSVHIYPDSQGNKFYPNSTGQPGGPGGPGVLNTKTQRPYRFVIENRTVKWNVGPTPCYNESDLLKELKRIAEDKSTWQPSKKDPTKLEPMQVVIEPHVGTYYADVAMTADAVKEAGFVEINFGGGLGAK
jgi:biopolymer transport protein ExbD